VVVEQGQLMPEAVSAASNEGRSVEVAIDAAGGGGARTYTYAVPPGLDDLVPGEAVLVEFGRRQALAVVLGDAPRPEGITLKPIAARVRTDGPLLPPLSIAFARWISDHYLAPPAIVIRAMLPPGLLERLDLVAERRPGETPGGLAAADRDLLEQLDRGPRAVRDLVAPEGRAGLIRRLRALEADGLLTLDWNLSVAGAGPRYERWLQLTGQGRALATVLAAGERPPGRQLGPRQAAALQELAAAAASDGDAEGDAGGEDSAGDAGAGPS
jgi:primosomal protein N'